MPEGKKEKRRSFLPTPKSFAAPKEAPPHSYIRQPTSVERFSAKQPGPVEHSRPSSHDFVRQQIEHSRPPLQVGDKVCISGIKLGYLRYFGKTHIAPGIWCGIELDEPEGKHDGQVESVRYFNCRYGYGIFAPVEKVTKIDLLLHDVQNDVIEEESEVVESPVESDSSCSNSAPVSQVLIGRSHRRLLPQPQSYVRRGSKEYVDIPSKIDEQNEEQDELDFIRQEQISQGDFAPQVGEKTRPAKRLPTIDGGQVRRISSDPSSNPALSVVPLSTSEKPGEDNKENHIASSSSALNVTYTHTDGTQLSNLNQNAASSGAGKVPLKPSRIPGTSKLPQPPTLGKSDNVQEIKELGDKVKTVELNSTYTVLDQATTQVNTSSSDECLSGEIQECLDSDRRHFLNLTFDTESGNSPPRLVKATDDSFLIDGKGIDPPAVDLNTAGTAPALEIKPEVSVDRDSSLGILDLNDVDPCASKILEASRNASLGILDVNHLCTDLLQESEGQTRGSKSNLTDNQKLCKVVVHPKRQSRIASLGDGFDTSGVVTSTPLVSEGVSRVKGNKSVLKNSVQLDSRPRLPSTQEEVFDEECSGQILDEVKTNLNCTFDVQDGKEVEIVGVDTLDWRQEASDLDEVNDKVNDSDDDDNISHYRLLNFTHVIVKDENVENEKVQSNKEDSLIEKFSNLEIGKNTSQNQKQLLTVQKGKKPMTDSGISELGDVQSMAGSTEMKPDELREGMDPGGDLDTLLEHISSDELQLQADLVAGHLMKKDRPLSLYSTTSADTGKYFDFLQSYFVC